jgi:hypothetical protein
MDWSIPKDRLSERELAIGLGLGLLLGAILLFAAVFEEGVLAQKRGLYQELLAARRWWKAYGQELPSSRAIESWSRSQGQVPLLPRLTEELFRFCRSRNDLRLLDIQELTQGVQIRLEGRSAAFVDLLARWEENFPEIAVRSLEVHRGGRTAASPLRATLVVHSLLEEPERVSSEEEGRLSPSLRLP